MCARLAAGQDPRIVRKARQSGEHSHRRWRERYRPGSRLRIRKRQLARGEVHTFPPQAQDLVPATPRQHQQPDRGNRAERRPSQRFRLVQHTRQALELRVGQEPLAPTCGVFQDRPARIGSLGHHAPLVGQRVHVRERLDRRVRGRRPIAQGVVKLRDMGAFDRGQGQLAQRGDDVQVHRAPRGVCGPRLAAHRDMVPQIPGCELPHGRSVRELRRQWFENRLLTRLNPRDDQRRPAPRVVCVHDPMTPDRHPLRRLPFPRSPRLCHIDVATRRIGPCPEASQLAVPDHRVALDPERRHHAVGNRPRLQLCHAVLRFRPQAASSIGPHSSGRAACGTT